MGHAIDGQELLNHLSAERVASAAGREGELVLFRVRVGPDEVGHGSLVGDLAEAVDDFDLVDAVDGGREAAVDAENLVVDDNTEGEEVEHVGEVVPNAGVAVLARALGVEAVALGDAAALVVAADQVDAVRVAQLEADKQRDGLDAEHAAVDVVTQEEVVGVGAPAADLEDFDQVVELAVDVAHHRHGRLDVHHVALAHQ